LNHEVVVLVFEELNAATLLPWMCDVVLCCDNDDDDVRWLGSPCCGSLPSYRYTTLKSKLKLSFLLGKVREQGLKQVASLENGEKKEFQKAYDKWRRCHPITTRSMPSVEPTRRGEGTVRDG
jgi:hypothetical protein